MKIGKIVAKEIQKIHSYDIPCIIKINVEVNKEYDDWISDETD
ncbi:MAG: divalent cation tolerance protein CutA [archaeon]